VTARSNAEWLAELGCASAAGDPARRDLRGLLRRGLTAALRARSVDAGTLDDLVQESVIAVTRGLSSFRDESRFSTWAIAIAVRVAFSELRRRHHRHLSFEALTADAAHPGILVLTKESRHEAHIDGRRILDVLRAAIELSLTDRQRRLIGAELRGLSQDEIARAFGVSRNAVYKLGHDARRALLRAFEAAGITREDLQHALSAEELDEP
jgi:RNA polymerase sigma-70 factor (ECF subfamily)